MRQVESLSHTRWECKYHIVFIPKYRRKALFRQLRKELGEVFHRLARQKESRIGEGHTLSDHVHTFRFHRSMRFRMWRAAARFILPWRIGPGQGYLLSR